MLLNHFKWDREKLMEAWVTLLLPYDVRSICLTLSSAHKQLIYRYYDSSSPEKLFREAHIAYPGATKLDPDAASCSSAGMSRSEKKGVVTRSSVAAQQRQGQPASSNNDREGVCSICLSPVLTEVRHDTKSIKSRKRYPFFGWFLLLYYSTDKMMLRLVFSSCPDLNVATVFARHVGRNIWRRK